MEDVTLKKWIAGAVIAGVILLTGCKSSPAAVTQEPPTVASAKEAQQPTSPPDKKASESNRLQVQETTSSEYKVQPTPTPAPIVDKKNETGGAPAKKDTDEELKEQPPATPPSTQSSQTEATKEQADPSTSSSVEDAALGQQRKEIVQKYEEQLEQIKAADLDKLNGLYDQVLTASQTGLSQAEVYEKFAQQASAMEEEVQAQVNQVLMNLKNELTARQLPTDSVNELRSRYYAEVNKAESQIMNKLKSNLGK